MTKSKKPRAHGLSHARYRETDKRLFKGLRRLVKHSGVSVRVSALSKEAKISRKAIYHHYKKPNKIFRRKEEELLESFKALAESLTRTQPSTQIIFMRIMVFIREHRDYFYIMADLESSRLIANMMNELRPLITKRWTDYGNMQEVYFIYSREIATLIFAWCKYDKLSEKAVSYYTNCMVHITKSANTRFSGLPRHEGKADEQAGH